MQEKLIFLPSKLDKSYQFNYNGNWEEINFKVDCNITLNGLLFKADSSKGLIFYLHGNAGSLSSWGNVASTYTALNYDVLILDYRGYGKSDGFIGSEQQLYDDNQIVYNEMLKRYEEKKVIVLGYSIGTGMAAQLASTNKPKLLVLQAPFFSLTNLMHQKYPLVPNFILKYKFNTYQFVKACKMPVVIFHGNNDAVINYEASKGLEKYFKLNDTLITLEGQSHIGITDNEKYQKSLKEILDKE